MRVVANDGGTAFPAQRDGFPTEGMSLREYFAGKAMQVVYAADVNGNFSDELIARASYHMANAMIKARATL